MRTLSAVLLGILVGILALVAFRFAFAAPEPPTHFHANWAVWVDGQRLDLTGDRFMEDVSACQIVGKVLPTQRVHLHNHDMAVVHVHQPGVTWGHLLANLGMGIGQRYLALADGTLRVDSAGRTLKVVPNGRPESVIDNQLIRSGDRLLISYGPESAAEVLRTQFPRVAANAEEFNRKPDPAG